MSSYQLIARPCPPVAGQLAEHISPLLARLYAARGVDSAEQLSLKLNRLIPAQQLKGLDCAVKLLDQAIDQQTRILIVGDFDADGATSTALMMLALGQMGACVHYLVPDRFKYGYGLTPEIVALAIDDYQPQLIVTVDNGISSHSGVEAAHAAGIKVIITDHHLTTKTPPECAAVVNPNQPDCNFGSKALAGVGVAFYVLAALATQRKQQSKASINLTQYLDIVAIGTVADVAQLDFNNRILVAAGVERIRQGVCRPGVLALLEVAGREAYKISPQDLGFVIGPRINAAGRMENMRIGIDCLLANSFDEAWPLAQKLDELNRERRRVEAQMKQEALDLLAHSAYRNLSDIPPAIVLFEPNWHQGVIGIVAGRLKEQFHRPTIVFAPSEDGLFVKGSARSIAGIHIRDAIERVAEQYPELVSHFGGHAMAAGLTLPRQQFEAFTQVFQQIIAEHDPSLFDARLLTDGELQAHEFSLDTARDLAHAGPWGQGFPAPLFEGLFKVLEYRWLQDKHLKLLLQHPDHKQRIDAIYFNAKRQHWPDTMPKLRLVYQLDINEYQGRQRLQLLIQHAEIVT
ncbi:single-stranded-DNA-specific exonuclease RecJ [Alkanindiges illinoisensis]|uniref:Single-stranded-DNA-specific exonuclease RecJ n=1 Tax=Alkanindiges illinoisensis TaxID=197183 RepID=A0A4Y7XC96_9GAMM|nr:single-stranded-DNA-specific exonuclease RecJ [Alkanindiges illinoisensis]TEU26842.1 single-stranded-DNA-specific exonuclease RecJ [Alkanindiges illinoisensis]